MTEIQLVNDIKILLSQGCNRKQICEQLVIGINRYKHLNAKYKFNKAVECEKLYMDKEWLEEKYRQYESAKKIAELCNSNEKVITYWRKKHNIERAKRGIGNRIYKVNRSFFAKIDSEEKAYWLGFIMADGCVSEKSENSKRLYIGLSIVDIAHLEKLKKALESQHIIRIAQTKNHFDSNKTVQRCDFTINALEICNDLIALGCIPRKSGFESMSDKIPHELKRHFIRGFFDGDGSIKKINSFNSGFHICSGSSLILKQISIFLNEELDIATKVTKNNRPIYKTDFYEINSYRVKENLKIFKYIYTNCNVYLERKNDVIKAFFDKYAALSSD